MNPGRIPTRSANLLFKICYESGCLTYNLEECHEAIQGIVEVDLRVDPAVALGGALSLVRHNGDGQPVAQRVHALIEPPAEELDAHDAEDEPEHQAHQQYIANARDGEQQRIHDDLSKRKA